MLEGPLAALDAMEKATGERDANVIGYCLGGTLLACDARLHGGQGRRRGSSATFFTSAGRLQASRASSASSSTRSSWPRSRSAWTSKRLSRRRGHGDHLQHAARQRPDLVLRGQQLPPRQGAVPVRPPLLELRLDAHAGGHAQLLSAQHVPGEQAGRAGRHHARGHADRSAQDQDCRPTSSRPARTTSRPGAATYRRDPALSRPGHASCWRAPATSPAWSTRRRRRSTATGPTTRCPTDRRDAWLADAKQNPGSWWPEWERWIAKSGDARSPPASPATASSSRSRTRRAPT